MKMPSWYYGWKSTIRIHLNRELYHALTKPLNEEDFTEVQRPQGHVWLVTDSANKTHKVTADYIAQPVDNGYVNFVRRGEANAGIVDSFYHPVSVRKAE